MALILADPPGSEQSNALVVPSLNSQMEQNPSKPSETPVEQVLYAIQVLDCGIWEQAGASYDELR